MTKNDVKIGNYYYFKFSDEWASDFNGAYKIKGYSSPDVIATLSGGQSLFSLMFESRDLDSDKYYSFIDNSTLIFIATKLVTTDPIEEEESTVYIPSSILNYNKSYEYTKANRLIYTFTSSPRIFDSELARNTFETESKNIVKKAIVGTTEFRVDNASITIEDTEVLTTQSEYNQFISKRIEENNKSTAAAIQAKVNREAAERKLYESALSMKNAKSDYETRYNELTSKINEANKIVQTNTEQKAVLANIKTYIIDVIADILIRDPTAFDGIPGYVTGNTAEQIYNLIYASVTS